MHISAYKSVLLLCLTLTALHSGRSVWDIFYCVAFDWASIAVVITNLMP